MKLKRMIKLIIIINLYLSLLVKENLIPSPIFSDNFYCFFNFGKPGCSKLLTIIIQIKKDIILIIYYLTIPKLVLSYSFKGSLTSTSKGVLKIFENERKFLKKNMKKLNNEGMNLIN